ncbi:ATP-binding protein [Kitasatospora sp. NPDC001574]
MSVTSLERCYHAVLSDLEPEALSAIREVTRIHLRLWLKEELAFTAELGVSDLLTNVLVHASGDCELLVSETGDGVVVSVTDFDGGLPAVKAPTEGEEGGRGLFLISQLADEFEIHQLTRGKQVWFRLVLASGAAGKGPEPCGRGHGQAPPGDPGGRGGPAGAGPPHPTCRAMALRGGSDRTQPLMPGKDQMDATAPLTTDTRRVFDAFYTTVRAGQVRLSDGGGPFGFDIQTALQVDYLIRVFDCDGVVETGTFLGDTADYLARAYPKLSVRSCEIDPAHAAVAAHRLERHDNAALVVGDSAAVLPQLLEGLRRPLLYLDAHWGEDWPLSRELAAVGSAVVAVDDFDIGHGRFGFDTYDGTACGPALVSQALPQLEHLYVGDPEAHYPLPCLQTGRRSGTGYLALGLDQSLIGASPMFRPVPLLPQVVMPAWRTSPAASPLAQAGAAR